MASHDETLDPNAPQPAHRPKPPQQPSPPPRRPAHPPGATGAGAAGETVAPDSLVQRQHARQDQQRAQDGVAHPKQFGNYRILPNAVLGQGGMGVVYTAEQQHPKRLVALKVIRPMLGTREMVKRFRLEADVLGRLEHPGIARIYEAGSADAGAGPQPFFAMELVKGQPLMDHVRAGNLALRDKLELIARIADAVHYAHEHGVIHRDLKPSNILVEPSGQPKILDFGVARVTDSDVQSATTDSGSLVGTVQYMSPEQASGIHREIDARSDVYALGLIAYEILAGKYPLDLANASLFEALRVVREHDVPALSSQDRQLRGDVETIVHKAVEKEKGRRYGSAAEFASDIRKHLAHRPISARPRSFGYVASRYLRRNRVLVGSVAAAALVIALGVAWMTSGREATAARRLNELSRTFDERLAKADWGDPASADGVSKAIADLAAASPADGAGAQRRMDDRLAEHVRRTIYSPNVDPAKIESALALLAATDPDRSSALRTDLAGRLAAPESALLIDAATLPTPGTPAANLFRVVGTSDASPVTFVAPPKARLGAAVPLGVNCGENTRAELTLPPSWEQLPAIVGFSFAPLTGGSDAVTIDDRSADGYTMVLDVEYLTPDGQVPPATMRTMAAARAADGNVTLTIRRRAKTLRTTKWKVSEVPAGKVRLVAARNGDRISAQLNDLPPLVARDAFAPPLAGASVAVKLSNNQPIERLAVARKPLPATPHPLEAADARFAAGAYDEALSRYETVTATDPDAKRRGEAQFKQAVCLARLKRVDESIALLKRVLDGDDERWSPLAGCQLWLLYLESDHRPQAYEVFDLISAKYTPRQLAEALPDDMRRTLLGIYVNDFSGFNLLRRPDPVRVERLRQASALRELLDPDVARFYLLRAYESAEDFPAAERVSDESLADGINLYGWYAMRTLEAHATLKRVLGRPREALDRIHEALLDADADARPQFWALMVDRARLLDAMGDFEQAEKDLDAFIQHRQDRLSYAPLASASLMLGFLRAERGDAAAAREAWRAGRYSVHESQLPARTAAQRDMGLDLGTQEILAALALGCLSDDITDEQLDRLLNELTDSGSAGGHFDAFRRGMFRIPPRVVRAIFADERGRAWARRFGFRADPPPQQLRQFLALFLSAFLADGITPSSGAPLTAEQHAMVFRAATGMQRMYEHNRIQPPHMLQFALAWKGTGGPMGWDGLYESLDPDVRGPLGMVMADHFARGGDHTAAAAIRERAANDVKQLGDAGSIPAATMPTSAPTKRANVHVDAPQVRPPGSRAPVRTRMAATTPSKPVTVAANPPVQLAPAAPPPVPAPSPAALEAKLYEELRQQNAQAFRLRRDGKVAEAADLRRGVVEKAKATWPANDERVISFTVDYVELLLELKRYDQADALVRVAQANVAPSGPAADRVKSVAGRLHRAQAGSSTTSPSATRPTSLPTIATSPQPAQPVTPPPVTPPAAPQVNPLEAELKFVTDAINGRQYRDAEARLLEMYVGALSANADPLRHRGIALGLARVYDAWGKPVDAKVFRDRADAAAAPASQPAAGQPDPRKLEWIDAMNRQAFSLRQQNRLDLAETLRNRVVSEVKTVLPSGDKRVIAYQIDYVDLLLQMQKYEEAERQLLDAEKAATDPAQSATLRRALIRTYETWGKPERARAIQNRPATTRPAP